MSHGVGAPSFPAEKASLDAMSRCTVRFAVCLVLLAFGAVRPINGKDFLDTWLGAGLWLFCTSSRRSYLTLTGFEQKMAMSTPIYVQNFTLLAIALVIELYFVILNRDDQC
jgi:hypothetical protein